MAVRRAVFDAFGGLEALGAQLADDAAMGRFTAELGHRVVLARYVAATVVDETQPAHAARTRAALGAHGALGSAGRVTPD